MRRRILVAILGTVTLSLVLSGVGTYLLLARQANRSTETGLRAEAEALVTLIDLSRPAKLGAIRQQRVIAGLRVEDISVLVVGPAGRLRGEIPEGVTADDLPPIRSADPVYSPLIDRPYMIVDRTGAAVGYVAAAPVRRGPALLIENLELYPHVNWAQVMPDLLRELAQLAARTPQRTAAGQGSEPAIELAFNLGRAHPLYDVLGAKLAARYEPPDGWYVRVADVPAFLKRVGPVLEARLASSPLVGYTGDLKIDFYRGGLRLAFEQGKLMSAEPWQEAPYGDECHAHFPPLIFLQLLLGYRSLDELYAYFQDVWPKDEARLLLNTLFPKQPSWVPEMCII